MVLRVIFRHPDRCVVDCDVLCVGDKRINHVPKKDDQELQAATVDYRADHSDDHESNVAPCGKPELQHDIYARFTHYKLLISNRVNLQIPM